MSGRQIWLKVVHQRWASVTTIHTQRCTAAPSTLHLLLAQCRVQEDREERPNVGVLTQGV